MASGQERGVNATLLRARRRHVTNGAISKGMIRNNIGAGQACGANLRFHWHAHFASIGA